EAAAENEAGGRRKEIADEAIRETACVEAERLTPPFHEKWRKSKAVSMETSGLFCFSPTEFLRSERGVFYCLPQHPVI
ncbi:MAG: hypothetical protein IJ422_05085, partial [Oscillospiraceae bacterium]|nr:hypothetical protein [Oscillospiraceae bacterium]